MNARLRGKKLRIIMNVYELNVSKWAFDLARKEFMASKNPLYKGRNSSH